MTAFFNGRAVIAAAAALVAFGGASVAGRRDDTGKSGHRSDDVSV